MRQADFTYRIFPNLLAGVDLKTPRVIASLTGLTPDMVVRKIYAQIDYPSPSGRQLDASVVLRFNGAEVTRLPFAFKRPNQVNLRIGAYSALGAGAGAGDDECFIWKTTAQNMVMIPYRVRAVIDTIEYEVTWKVDGGVTTVAVWLGCYSEYLT